MKRIVLTCLFYVLLLPLFAQQNAQYGQYIFNGLYINPAYAGYKDEIYMQAFFRSQWTGIKGGPQSLSISIDAPAYKGKIGLGAIVTKDKIGAQSSLNAVGNFAYRIKLDREETKTLAFGLGVGITQIGLNGALLDPTDIGDLRIPVGYEKRTAPDVRVGIQYTSDRFFLGFSANNLVSQYLNAAKDFNILNMKIQPHFYLTSSTFFKLNPDLIFKPAFLIKDDLHGPTSMDLNAFLLFKEKIWIGALYRTSVKLYPKKNLQNDLSNQSAIGFITEFFVKRNFRIGYGYDYSLNKLANYDNGSHEISIGYYLNTIRSQKKLCNCF